MNFKKEKGILFLLFTGFILCNCIVNVSSTTLATSPTPISDISIIKGDWIEKTNTLKAGGYGESLSGTDHYIYVVRCMYKSSTPYFWRYNSSTDNWDYMSISGLPIGAFRNGAALAWDYDNYIYALLGGRYTDSSRTLFYRYNISNNYWEKLANTPQAQGAGDALTFSGYDNNIYAITGSSKHLTAFTCYNLSNNSWSILPFNQEWTGTDDGASLVWTGGEYLFALQGEWQETIPNQEFARFHIPTRTWDNMTSIPESGGIADGASLLWIYEYPEYIFALGGGSCLENPGYNFYYYNISQDSWDELESIPCPIGYYTGNRLGFTDGYIYYWQGAPSTWDCNGDTFYMFEFQLENQQLTADPNGPYTGIIEEPITFDGSGSSDPNGSIVSYSWNFGDGNTGNGMNPTHTYTHNGTYTINLTVTDNEDNNDTATTIAVILDKADTINSSTHIIINEIEQNPSGTDSGNEWVELYNPTTSDVDLNDWKLSTTHGNTVTITLYGIIPANGYIVFIHSKQWIDNEYESIILHNVSWSEIDRTPYLLDTDNNYRSWQRDPNGIDTDSNWIFKGSTKGHNNNGVP